VRQGITGFRQRNPASHFTASHTTPRLTKSPKTVKIEGNATFAETDGLTGVFHRQLNLATPSFPFITLNPVLVVFRNGRIKC